MKKNWSWARMVVLGVAVSGVQSSIAQAAGPAGRWKGTVQVPGKELHVEVDLAAKGPGAWTGTITMQNLRAFPLSSIEAQCNAVSFAMNGQPAQC